MPDEDGKVTLQDALNELVPALCAAVGVDHTRAFCDKVAERMGEGGWAIDWFLTMARVAEEDNEVAIILLMRNYFLTLRARKLQEELAERHG